MNNANHGLLGTPLARRPRDRTFATMNTMNRRIIRFIIVLFGMTILSSIVWQYVGDQLYDCTDDNMTGFLRPGGWVHRFGGREVVAVPKIAHDHSMSEPDTIKEGWSIGRLWVLWLSFCLVSAGISLLAAWAPWAQGCDRKNEKITEADKLCEQANSAYRR